MADYLPIAYQGDTFTSTTSGAVVGGNVLAVSGSGTVAVAGANSTAVVGVAAFDAASGAIVTYFRGGIQFVVTTGTVTAGDLVVSAASGTVSTLAAVTTPTAADVTNSRAVVGRALTTATTGLLVQVLFTV